MIFRRELIIIANKIISLVRIFTHSDIMKALGPVEFTMAVVADILSRSSGHMHGWPKENNAQSIWSLISLIEANTLCAHSDKSCLIGEFGGRYY